MVLLFVVNSFLLLPTVTVQGLSIQWLELYVQGVFLGSQLLGNVASIAPQGEVVRVGRGRVGRPPVALLIVLLLALIEQCGGGLIVQGGPVMRGRGPGVSSWVSCGP